MTTPVNATDLTELDSPTHFVVGRESDGLYGKKTYVDLSDTVDAAAEAIALATPYASRAAAEAANVPSGVQRIAVIAGDRVLIYVKDAGGTALTTADGADWSPADTVTPQHFGATADGATDDRAAVQAGIDWLNANDGGSLYFPPGTYVVGASGSQIATRDYGLLLKSNVTLAGDGMFATILKAEDGSDIDLINTDRSVAQVNIGLRNLTLDGNEAAMSGAAEGFNAWFYDITDLSIENVKSLNPASWGLRFEQCSRVFVSNVLCDHSDESNSDGVHFVDTSNVVASNMWITSLGDDAFIIEATHADVDSYSISDLYVQSQTGLGGGSRGVLLLADETVVSGARLISNVAISGLVCKDTSGSGVSLRGASFEGIRISGTIDGGCDDYGLILSPGTATYPGEITECVFDLTIRDITGNFVAGNVDNGTITDNTIRLRAANPGDGLVGANLYGDRWNGEIAIDYNEDGTKTTFNYGLAIYGDDNDLGYACRGAGTALLLQGSAQNNTVRLGSILGSATRDIEILGGATGNRFVGGRLSGGVLNSGGNTNKFFGVAGATTYGVTTLNMATEADGTAKFTHGLIGTPVNAVVSMQTAAAVHVNVIGLTSTEVDIQILGTAGAAITTGSYTIYYQVSL